MDASDAASQGDRAKLRLNRPQRQALRELRKFTRSQEKLYLLTGYAGTGKTTLLQALIQQLRRQGDRRRIVFTAFSNKATKVLEQMAAAWQLNIDCMTCCKLLGLRPDIDTVTGLQVFKPDPLSENHFDRYHLVVVDEASMINSEMWTLLTQAVNSLLGETQILFVGDVAQLPPIGEPESRVFSEIHQRSELQEVVRYGGAIALLAESIRNTLTSPRLPQFHSSTNGNRTEGVLVTGRRDWERLLVRAFQSEAASQDSDYVRALAYTNRRVDALNQQIRTAIYGVDTPRFVVGERLVANTPYIVGENLILQTSSECQVLNVYATDDGDWHLWQLHVLTDEGRPRTLKVLHEQSQLRFAELLRFYAEEKRWNEFWQLKGLFADLNYAYCLTIHKSQGSTFQNVFVDVPNALTNRNVRERNQLLYVAVTRAAQRLFLFQ